MLKIHKMLLIPIVNFFYANNFYSTFLTKFRNYFSNMHTHADLYSLDISYKVQKLFFSKYTLMLTCTDSLGGDEVAPGTTSDTLALMEDQ